MVALAGELLVIFVAGVLVGGALTDRAIQRARVWRRLLS